MSGVAVGTAALIGAAFGWWGVITVTFLALLFVVARPTYAAAATWVFAVLIAVFASWRADIVHPTGTTSDLSRGMSSAVVVTAPIRTGSRQYFVVGVQDAQAVTMVARVCVTSGAAPTVRIGDVVALEGKHELSADQSLATRSILAARDCAASLFALSVKVVDSSPSLHRGLGDVRSRLGAVLRGAAPGDSGVLLAGLVTGEDEGFSPERQQAFIQTGTTHLTAVSGSNLALVAGMLATVGAATIGRHRWSWQVVTVLGVWAYAFVSGAQPPSLRAAIVATAAIFAFRVGRRPDFATFILLAAGAMVILEPRQIVSLGFLLSVAASLALSVVVSRALENGRTSRLTIFLTATIAAQIATLPLLLPISGTVSLLSVPANIIAAPLVILAMPLAALASVTGLIWLPLGEAIAAPATLIASALIGVVDVLAASNGYIGVGIPPETAALALAVTAVALLLVIARPDNRELARERLDSVPALDTGSGQAMPSSVQLIEKLRRQIVDDAQNEADIRAVLPPLATRIVVGEDPLDALAAHLDNPEEQPAGQEIGHEVADVGKGGETVAREIGGHFPNAHPGREPEHDHQD